PPGSFYQVEFPPGRAIGQLGRDCPPSSLATMAPTATFAMAGCGGSLATAERDRPCTSAIAKRPAATASAAQIVAVADAEHVAELLVALDSFVPGGRVAAAFAGTLLRTVDVHDGRAEDRKR